MNGDRAGAGSGSEAGDRGCDGDNRAMKAPYRGRHPLDAIADGSLNIVVEGASNVLSIEIRSI
ncbi:MAG TPA: hypothetical protein VGC10_03910 [Sphingomonas sp.]